jgi:hypothetical protein
VSWLVKIGIFFGGLFALVALAWMVFLPRLAERGLRAATGFDVKVQVLSANPFTGHLLVKGLTAKNPPGYPAPDFVDLRGLEADADMFTLLPGKTLTFESIDLDVAKLDIIRETGRIRAGPCARLQVLLPHQETAYPPGPDCGSGLHRVEGRSKDL